MATLLIMTNKGIIFKANLPLHFMVAEKYNIELDDIYMVGFITKNNRVVWDDRKPH